MPRVGKRKMHRNALGHWRYGYGTVFPSSVIAADASKQQPATFPPEFYVDVLETCVTCKRPFIFFAEEQKHWYEELGFTIDAWCIHCVECRKASQKLRGRFERFSKSINRTDLTDDELATLVSDAAFLWKNGVLVRRDSLNRIRNIARKRIPGHSALDEIEEASQ